MTQLNEKYLLAEIDALRSLGLEKEALEKEAGLLDWGIRAGGKALFGAKAGIGKGIARVGEAFKSSKLVGAGTRMSEKAGLSNQISRRKFLGSAVKDRNAMRLARYRGPAKDFRPINVDRVSRVSGRMRTGKYGKVPTKPSFQPNGDAMRARMRQKAQDKATLNRRSSKPSDIGRKKGLRRDGTKVPIDPNTQGGIMIQTPNNVTQLPPNYFQKGGNPGLLTKTPVTDQAKLLAWGKANPVLAGAGGLAGYNALKSNGSGTTVVTR